MALMDKVVSLAKRRGFIFPSSEIYGGLNGAWDYGPLGVELKRNIKKAWWEDMILSHDETATQPSAPSSFAMVGLDSAILMNPKVWEASGHVGGFHDPMVDCRETKGRYRADQLVIFQLIAEGNHLPDDSFEDFLFASPGEAGKTPDAELLMPHKKRIKAIRKKLEMDSEFQIKPLEDALTKDTLRAKIFAPGASKPGTLTAPRSFELMLKTKVGALEDKSSVAYLRPETAQGIFVNFKNVCDTARVKLPFGIGQIGKAFRNEINPRNFTFRSREFEQMEIEFFCKPSDSGQWYRYWCDRRLQWYLDLGINPSRLHLREHDSSELAHYATGCADIEYSFPFGISELEGVANRTDFDLGQHMKASGKDLRYFDDAETDKEKRRYLPHVIEPSAGVDRATLAFLCDAYAEDEVGDEKRIVMKLTPRVAPIKAAVFPLVKKDGMPEKAMAIYRSLSKNFNSFYDEKGAIGRRYRRQDEAGTPFCITVDGDTISENTVTVRDRDTCEQLRLPVEELVAYINNQLTR